MAIGNSAFCLTLYLTGVHFRGELQHIGHVGGQKIKCRPIRTRETGGVRLQGELYAQQQGLTSLDNFKSSHPEVFFKKGVLKICSKFYRRTPMLRNFIEITHSAWVFSCKFTAYFQNTFS